MDKTIAAILALITGFLAGWFVTSVFADTFNTIVSRALIGAVAGGLVGGIGGSMVGSDLNRASDVVGVRAIIGAVVGGVAGALGGSRFEIVDYVLFHVRAALHR
jgi:hypothetical protein